MAEYGNYSELYRLFTIACRILLQIPHQIPHQILRRIMCQIPRFCTSSMMRRKLPPHIRRICSSL